MAFEIIDGQTGVKHITSEDLAVLNTALVGKAGAVFEYGSNFAISVNSANSVTIGTGAGQVDGKRFRNTSSAALTVQNGTQGQKRNDIVVARYATSGSDGSIVERVEVAVKRGTATSGTPADPSTTSRELALWRIPLDGITVGEPVRLSDPVPPITKLWDSISQSPRVITGTRSLKWVWSGVTCPLLSDSEFRALAGRSFDNDRDAAVVMNGDWSANGIPTAGAVWLPTDKTLYASMTSVPKMNSWLRINYALIVAP